MNVGSVQGAGECWLLMRKESQLERMEQPRGGMVWTTIRQKDFLEGPTLPVVKVELARRAHKEEDQKADGT